MDLQFYASAKKPFGKEITYNWAKIFLEDEDWPKEFEEDENQFKDTETMKAGNIPVFVNNKVQVINLDVDVLSEIKKIAERENSKVVLVCNYDFFKKVVQHSAKEEMQPKFIVTESRDMLHYAAIGEDQCALLVAYDG